MEGLFAFTRKEKRVPCPCRPKRGWADTHHVRHDIAGRGIAAAKRERVADAECGRVFCEGGRVGRFGACRLGLEHSMKDLVLIFISLVMGTAAGSAAPPAQAGTAWGPASETAMRANPTRGRSGPADRRSPAALWNARARSPADRFAALASRCPVDRPRAAVWSAHAVHRPR